jgi:Fis family transcriptional regulator
MSPTKQSLQDCVRENVETYFADLEGLEPANVHDMLMRAVEKPLLEVVMARAQHNQSRAAQWLGLNRNTLRKKLLEHGLLG